MQRECARVRAGVRACVRGKQHDTFTLFFFSLVVVVVVFFCVFFFLSPSLRLMSSWTPLVGGSGQAGLYTKTFYNDTISMSPAMQAAACDFLNQPVPAGKTVFQYFPGFFISSACGRAGVRVCVRACVVRAHLCMRACVLACGHVCMREWVAAGAAYEALC